jgi:hypothetical protein
MPTSPDPIRVSGHCYCGGVTFKVDIPAGDSPIFTAYCHCDSCRRAHAAPLYHVVCVDEAMFTLTGGAELIQEFKRHGRTITRAFCGTCGSRILNRFGNWRPGGRVPLAWFPNLLDEATQHALPEVLRPQRNNQPDECVLDWGFLQRVVQTG